MRRTYGSLLVGAAFVAASAQAAETISYTYDVHGRLVKVVRSGGPSSGAATTHEYDKADNRLKKTTTGAPPTG